MSENTGIVCVMALIILAAFLFAGKPDMTDAIIAKMMNGTCNPTPPENPQ